MKQLLLAIQFLTILPVRTRGGLSEREMGGSAVFFPAVGACQGLLAVSIGLLLMKLFSVEVVSGIILAALVMSNGGFHMDGIADTFDGLAVRSSGDPACDREKRLLAMKDSSTGAIGVTAVTLTILLKYLLISSVMQQPLPQHRYALLFLAPVFSKWIMVQAMYGGRAARTDGLGKMFIGSVTGKDALLSFFLTIFFSLIIAVFLNDLNVSAVVLFFLLTFAAVYLFCRIWGALCDRRFGGLTGDTLGAQGELSEILFLMVGSSWLQHSI